MEEFFYRILVYLIYKLIASKFNKDFFESLKSNKFNIKDIQIDNLDYELSNIKKIDDLLDLEVKNFQLEFKPQNNPIVFIKTCRQYMDALKQGYAPENTIEMKMQYGFLIPTSLIMVAKNAKKPKKTFLNKVNLASTELIPASSMVWDPVGDGELYKNYKTAKDLIDSDEFSLKDIQSDKLNIEDEGGGVALKELIRANITGNGLEDILVFSYQYATQGTFGYCSLGIFSRENESEILSYSDFDLKDFINKHS